MDGDGYARAESEGRDDRISRCDGVVGEPHADRIHAAGCHALRLRPPRSLAGASGTLKDPFAGVDRCEEAPRLAEQRLDLAEDEKSPGRERGVKALEEPFLRRTIEIDDRHCGRR